MLPAAVMLILVIISLSLFVVLKSAIDKDKLEDDEEAAAEVRSYLPFIILAVLILNAFLIFKMSQKALNLLLFPYGSSYIKFQFHQ